MPLGGELHISTGGPPVPTDADFGIRIDFKKGEGNPQRVFQSAVAMIGAMQRLDHALCAAVDTSLEPLMVLEEIETGSLIIWLKNILHRIDDEALKTLEWKPIVGRYLVRSKYAYIRWANRADGERTIQALAGDIRKIAEETDVKQFPDYAPPSTIALADATKGIENAKAYLVDGDKISYVVPDQPPADFDLAVRWDEKDLERMLVKETVKAENMPMTLIVKKPDYLGKSKWDFRHGGKMISANVGDEEWLRKFQTRQIDVRPGDAIRCTVNVENHYGYDNELVSETFAITKVTQILENQIQQSELDLPPGGRA